MIPLLASLVAIVAAAGIAACALYLLAYFAVDFAFLVQHAIESGIDARNRNQARRIR